jgi:hypothetical protein
MLRADFLLNGHGIHGKTRKNKCLNGSFFVSFRGFRGKNIHLFSVIRNKKPRSKAGLDENGWR